MWFIFGVLACFSLSLRADTDVVNVYRSYNETPWVNFTNTFGAKTEKLLGRIFYAFNVSSTRKKCAKLRCQHKIFSLNMP